MRLEERIMQRLTQTGEDTRTRWMLRDQPAEARALILGMAMGMAHPPEGPRTAADNVIRQLAEQA